MHMAMGGFHSPLQQLFLLEERARLAGVHLPDATDSDQRFYGIKCIINGMDCVINMRLVAEVIDDRKVTAIPGAAAWVEGVMNYRGTLVPVYRPHQYLSLSDSADRVSAAANGPLLIIRKDRKGGEFNALRINKMIGMQKFREADMHPVEKIVTTPDSLEYFVDNRINSESKNWYKLNISSLIEMMNKANPRQQQSISV